MRVLIVGCGYVGLPLGSALVQEGHEVFGIRRSSEANDALANEGVTPLNLDVTNPSELQSLPLPFDWVINTISSTKGGAEEYRSVYLKGTANLLECFRSQPPRKYIYTSSTSVYGQIDGSPVKETSPTLPPSETSRILVETEELLLKAHRTSNFPAIILRVAGIYGPDRGHLLQQYLKNEARIAGKGDRIINMIHRDDLVSVILSALRSGRPGEIYNVVDDEPVAQIHFFRWLSETLGKWMPPFATEAENAQRKRGLTNKRVHNRRLKMELGCTLKYPTFRQGYTAEIQRLQDAGLLNLDPEPRE
ncbi:MAG: NAD-dependent epimerase/dehydratase [Verrucomicrobiales bacterium]|nr:NAD-dependent epimerase/dehydratase [Verrucomicrobiales bacterium]